jgi:hypothetical protein
MICPWTNFFPIINHSLWNAFRGYLSNLSFILSTR